MDGLRKLALARARPRRWPAEGTAVAVITHDIDFAAEAAELVTTMARGRVLADRAPRDRRWPAACFPGQLGAGARAAVSVGQAARLLRGETEPSMSSLVLLLAIGCVVIGVSAVETGPNRSRELALVAALAAAAAGGRVLFAFIPNVQPVTIIVAVTGAALGARAGIAVGGAAALVSNAFLGQGPWTPWQMIGWGLVGGDRRACRRAAAKPLRAGRLRHRLGLPVRLADGRVGLEHARAERRRCTPS